MNNVASNFTLNVLKKSGDIILYMKPYCESKLVETKFNAILNAIAVKYLV